MQSYPLIIIVVFGLLQLADVREHALALAVAAEHGVASGHGEPLFVCERLETNTHQIRVDLRGCWWWGEDIDGNSVVLSLVVRERW